MISKTIIFLMLSIFLGSCTPDAINPPDILRPTTPQSLPLILPLSPDTIPTRDIPVDSLVVSGQVL